MCYEEGVQDLSEYVQSVRFGRDVGELDACKGARL